jgi:hypothetical protein
LDEAVNKTRMNVLEAALDSSQDGIVRLQEAALDYRHALGAYTAQKQRVQELDKSWALELRRQRTQEGRA